jgi:5-methylcytosine-specific restriction endonuclease McrA
MASTDSTTKQCTRCKEFKPATREFFSRGGNRDGLNSWCKACYCDREAIKRRKQGIRRKGERKPLPTSKACTSCKRILPLSDFGVRGKNDNWPRPKCKTCISTQRGHIPYKPLLASADGLKVCRKCHNEYPATLEHFHNKGKRLNARCKLCESEAFKNKYLADPSVYKLRAEKRRIKKLGATGSHTAADIKLQYRSQNGKCWHCNKPLNGVFEVDHLIPLDRGGSNWPNNLVCSCQFCNRSKNNKLTHEWNGRLL